MPEKFRMIVLRCGRCGAPLNAYTEPAGYSAGGRSVFLSVEPCPACLQDEADRATSIIHGVARLDSLGVPASELESAVFDLIKRKREESAAESEVPDA
jgi:hypothetical protein